MNWTDPDEVVVVILDADAVRRRAASGHDDRIRDAEDIGILRPVSPHRGAAGLVCSGD